MKFRLFPVETVDIDYTEGGLYKACRLLASIAVIRQNQGKEEDYETACHFMTRALLNIDNLEFCVGYLKQGFRYLGYYPVIKGIIVCPEGV